MENSFAYPCQKILKKYENDVEIGLIIKDIANAQQGVVSFSKEVKKYMLSFIHKRYDDNQEVMGLIEILKQWSRYQSFNELEIFKLQEEAYFWYDFLNCYAIWKVIEKVYGFQNKEESLKILIRLFKYDVSIFKEFDKL